MHDLQAECADTVQIMRGNLEKVRHTHARMDALGGVVVVAITPDEGK